MAFKILPDGSPDLSDLETERETLVAEVRTLTTRSASLEGDDLARFESIEARMLAIQSEADLRRRMSRFAGLPNAYEPGDEGSFNVNRVTSADPWSERASFSSDLDRSKAIVDRVALPEHADDAGTRQILHRLLGEAEEEPIVHRWMVAASDPAYVSLTNKMFRNPERALFLASEEERRAFGRAEQVRAALAEGGTTTGGFMVPIVIDPAIILTNAGTINPFRQIADVRQTASQTLKLVTSAGVTAEWTAEAAEAADASPTVAQPTITPVRWDAYLQASFEMLDDTNIAEQVQMLIADAKARLEGTAFAVGTGVTQPTGVVTTISGTTASRVAGSSGAAGAADFVLGDVYALDNALPARFRPNSSWLAHRVTQNKVRRFGEGTTANAAYWTDLGPNVPSLLLGHPMYESSDMDSTIVSGSNDDVLLLGDFKRYLIADRIGTNVVFNPLVIGSNRRPTGEAGWFAYGRTGGAVVDPTAFVLLRL